jgi:putative Ca2+/H+ antiporter (TMEM165/GDT1 family)
LDFAVALTVFAIIFLAELPDKTALASLVLGTRYRPLHVFTGVAAAFTVHVALAIAAGSLLALLPHRLLQVIIGALFLLDAVLLLRGRRGHGEEHLRLTAGGGRKPSSARVASTSFFVILAAEFGDLTQIVTANLAARYHEPVSVGAGAVLGLWAVAALAIAGGRGLLRLVPITAITRTAAAVMLVLAAITLISAIHGPALHSAARYLPRTTTRSGIVPNRCPMAVTDSEGPAVQPSRVPVGGQANCQCQCRSQAR